MEGELLSLTRSADELSVVCRSDRVPEGVVSERGWRVLQVAGPLGFEMTGILSSLTSPLAEQGISVFAVSTYKTDYLMVKSRQIVAATVILGRKFEIL
ncbi:MAG: ACT domain-containing protein [Bacteroidetes bacterium]|nr:MAG: ACT domain-containing protein [Bacteroidota bacterium]